MGWPLREGNGHEGTGYIFFINIMMEGGNGESGGSVIRIDGVDKM